MELVEGIGYLKEILDEDDIRMAKSAGKNILNHFHDSLDKAREHLTHKGDNDNLLKRLKHAASRVNEHLKNREPNGHDKEEFVHLNHKNFNEKQPMQTKIIQAYKHGIDAAKKYDPNSFKDRASEVLSNIGRRINKLNNIRSLRGDH